MEVKDSFDELVNGENVTPLWNRNAIGEMARSVPPRDRLNAKKEEDRNNDINREEAR